MRQKLLWVLLALTPVTLTACGSTDNDGSVYSDDAYGTVTLCDYKNLSAEKTVYPVTDEDIQSEMENMLYDYVEYEETDGPSEIGDNIAVDLTAEKDGETVFSYTGDDSYEIYLGSEEFGTEFDEKLTGVSVGDELSFSVTYDADFEFTDLAGGDVSYTVTVLGISKEIMPELTDDFITDTLGYESRDALEQEIREYLESENEANSAYELRENLLQQVIDGSTFDSYSQDLYDSYAAGIEAGYESYMELFGCETVEEVYDLFEMTEEDVEKEIITQVYRTIIVHAISDAEKLELSDTEYQDGLERYTTEIGYDSTDELLEDYDEDSLREWILEDKVLDFLEKYASTTEKEFVPDTEGVFEPEILFDTETPLDAETLLDTETPLDAEMLLDTETL